MGPYQVLQLGDKVDLEVTVKKKCTPHSSDLQNRSLPTGCSLVPYSEHYCQQSNN